MLSMMTQDCLRVAVRRERRPRISKGTTYDIEIMITNSYVKTNILNVSWGLDMMAQIIMMLVAIRGDKGDKLMEFFDTILLDKQIL